MSHRLLRGTLMPFATGLAAVISVLGVLGFSSALGATTAAASTTVRGQEWWLAGLHVTQAWRNSEGAGIIVAVLGTGVAADQPDLAGDVITGPDYSDSGRAPGSVYWGVEGTAVAGIIAGHGHGPDGVWGAGIVGIAPAARILSVRVTLEFNDPLALDPAISQRLPDAIADGIRYAVDRGARVIELPLDPGTLGMTSAGDPVAAGGSAAERAAVAYALRRNVVLVAPAGDNGQGSQIVNYPAAYPGVIAVGAVGRTGQLAPFSSRHSYALLTAPGVDLVVAAPPNDYDQISSTSTASGIVAGIAALILAKYPGLTVAQVTRALIESTVTTADGTGLPPVPARSGTGAGYGTVDAFRALEEAAFISSQGRARPQASPPARPRQPARRPAAAPRRADASTLAGSVLRASLAAVGLLIVLLVTALLVGRSRRGHQRGSANPAAARSRARGQHEHRRPGREAAAPVTAADHGAAGPGSPWLAQPAPPATDRWPSPGGWQGGGIGAIGHPSSGPYRPLLAPVPRSSAGSRASRSAGTQGRTSGPPWEPAPEPGRTIGPLPVASPASPLPEPGRGIRVPGDMAALPAAAADFPLPSDLSPAPAGADLSTPPVGFDLSTPAFGLTPPAFDFPAPPVPDQAAAPRPDLAGPPVPDQAGPPVPDPAALPVPDQAGPPVPDHAPLPGPDHTPLAVPDQAALPVPDQAALPVPDHAPLPGPDQAAPEQGLPAPAEPDVPTRQSLDFAAAPVPADYATAYFAEPEPGDRAVAVPAADPSYIWDLAATDVFPAATDPGPPHQPAATPDVPPAPEEGSGTGGS